MDKGLIGKGVGFLAVMWVLVWFVSDWAAERKASAGRVVELMESADLSDWSEDLPQGKREIRREKLEEIATVFNRLDLRQREELNKTRAGYELFRRLGAEEKMYFLDLTLTQSMKRMMEAFDHMESDERREMVSRAIKDLENGPGGEDLMRLREEDPEIIDRIVQKGLQAYYQEADAETKLDLVPLMDSFGEVIQGFAKPTHEL